MKILVPFACLFAIVFAQNREVLRSFHNNVAQCAQELNKPMTDADVVYCNINKLGLIDGQNRYILEKGLAMLDDLISDEVKRNQAKEIIRNCYNTSEYEENDPANNEEQTKKSIQCAVPMLTLIDPKPQ